MSFKMLSSLAGRTYVVTGGASGIGLATVRKLLGLSATVHSVDRSSAPFPETAAPGQLFVHPGVDVTSREAVATTFKQIFSQTPSVHGLVNAAGVSPSGNYRLAGPDYAIETDSTYDFCMEVNSRGTWNTVTELLVHTMNQKEVERNAISVVNIGSLASIGGIRTMAAYTASKHATLGLTRSWALEYAAKSIRFNMILPGLIRTPLGASALDTADERGEATKAYVEAIPMKRVGEADEIAGPILFFLSDESSYITGEAIVAGGGSLPH